MKKAKLLFYFYLVLIILFVILKFDGSFYLIRDTMQTIKWSREEGAMNINYIPLKTILSQFRNSGEFWALKNLFVNLAAFIPWGILFPLSYKQFKKFIPFTVATLIMLLFIECIQFIFMIGFFDVDDILLNYVGACIGFFIGYIFKNTNLLKTLKEFSP